MKLCRVCGVGGRALCLSCQGKISAASPKSITRLARWHNSTEGKANLARARELPQTKVAQREAGRIQGRKNVESGVLARISKLPQSKAARREVGRKAVESGALARARELPQTKVAQREVGRIQGRIQGRKNVESGVLAKASKKAAAAKPTWPEARFYGLVFGWFNGLKDFHFQEVIPTEHCAHRVDARHEETIFELDGGGHHAFRDRHEHDRLVDDDYSAMGYRVVRATNASDLFLRVLQTMERP